MCVGSLRMAIGNFSALTTALTLLTWLARLQKRRTQHQFNTMLVYSIEIDSVRRIAFDLWFNRNVCAQTCDIVAETSVVMETTCGKGAPYDVCLDKGTYDAICLCADDVDVKKQRYVDNVYALTKDEGLFIITSCNWTREELLAQFQHSKLSHQCL